MARTLNGSLIGRAAALERQDRMLESDLRLWRERREKAKREKRETQALCMNIASVLYDDEWRAWLASTPNDNAGFLAAARDKWAELQAAAASRTS